MIKSDDWRGGETWWRPGDRPECHGRGRCSWPGAFFMEMLDGTIVATAAPSTARSLDVRSVDIGIAITAYLVTVAVFIPLSRWLADRVGARRLFFLAVLVFTLASALCATSTGLTMLTLTRVLQGIGGAMMVPVGRLVVRGPDGAREHAALRAAATVDRARRRDRRGEPAVR